MPGMSNSAPDGGGPIDSFAGGTATGPVPGVAGTAAPMNRPITDSTDPTATNMPALAMHERRGMRAGAAALIRPAARETPAVATTSAVATTGASIDDSH